MSGTPRIRERPRAVNAAVVLMLAGAAVALFEMVILAWNSYDLLSRFFLHMAPDPEPFDEPVVIFPPWIMSMEALADLMAALFVALALIVVMCCLWFAWLTSRGRNWARILATVLAIGFISTWSAMLTAAVMMNLADITFGSIVTALLPYCVAVSVPILVWTPRATCFFTQ